MLTMPRKIDDGDIFGVTLFVHQCDEYALSVAEQTFPNEKFQRSCLLIMVTGDGRNPNLYRNGDVWVMYIIQSKDNKPRKRKEVGYTSIIPLTADSTLLNISLSEKNGSVENEAGDNFGLWLDVTTRQTGKRSERLYSSLLAQYPKGIYFSQPPFIN